jgi:NADH-quinone oxidoreductase subunit E
MDAENKSEQLRSVLNAYREIPGSLITVLQKAQGIYGYLPQDVLETVAAELGVPSARVFGVATFYTQFRFQPVGKYFIELCKGTACHVNGADTIARTITEELGIADGETTADGLFSLKCVACLGCCSLSPVMMINGETFGSLTSAKVRDILAQKRKEAEADV